LYPYEGAFEVCEKNDWKYIKDVKQGDKSTNEPEESCFEYVTNLLPAADNIIELSAAGLRMPSTGLFLHLSG
jgi:hypothetical protein